MNNMIEALERIAAYPSNRSEEMSIETAREIARAALASQQQDHIPDATKMVQSQAQQTEITLLAMKDFPEKLNGQCLMAVDDELFVFSELEKERQGEKRWFTSDVKGAVPIDEFTGWLPINEDVKPKQEVLEKPYAYSVENCFGEKVMYTKKDLAIRYARAANIRDDQIFALYAKSLPPAPEGGQNE